MDFSFSREQQDLRREARAFLAGNPAPTMAELVELGWVGVLAGGELTFLDAAVLFEELGRALYAGPYVLNEVAGMGGEEVWSIEIDGFVPHLQEVQRVLLPGMRAAPAVGETLATVDESLRLGRLSGEGAEPLARADLARARADGSWDEVRRRLLAALALEAVGVGSKAVELAVEYVKEREQFGRRIGAYQAVSHPLVDAYVAVELARSLAYWAAWCVAESDGEADRAVAAAKSQASEAAVFACERSLQAHGGVGFTWEHPLHRYYKRALWLDGALGYGREHRAALAASLL